MKKNFLILKKISKALTLCLFVIYLGTAIENAQAKKSKRKKSENKEKSEEKQKDDKEGKITEHDFANKLKLDEEQIDRSQSMPLSLSPVIKKAQSCVISIKSTMVNKEDPKLADFFERYFKQFGIPEDQIKKLKPNEYRKTGIGSGVIITSDGYAITNSHVVNDAEEIVVRLSENNKNYEAEVIGTDERSDVAVIKIKPKTKNEKFPAITITDSDKIEVGDFVLAIGSPFDLPSTVTMGIISAKNRRKYGFDINDIRSNFFLENFIQTDASINIGNSGGPLIDMKGRLIGINTAIFSPSGGNAGIGFAIPINSFLNIAQRLVEKGVVERGFLGVKGRDVDAKTAKYFGRDNLYGALVEGVLPGTPAERAGLKVSDLILEVDGERIDDFSKLRLLIGNMKPGTKIKLKIQRKNLIMDKMLKLGKIPTGITSLKRTKEKSPEVIPGVKMKELTDEEIKETKSEEVANGAIYVDEIDADSAAYKDELREGDIILKIGGRKITSLSEAHEQIQKSASNGVVFLSILRDGQVKLLAIELN